MKTSRQATRGSGEGFFRGNAATNFLRMVRVLSAYLRGQTQAQRQISAVTKRDPAQPQAQANARVGCR